VGYVRRKGVSPYATVLVGLAVSALAVAWVRNSINGIIGKDQSDRALKTEVTPVRW
jgi:hypothetical protein